MPWNWSLCVGHINSFRTKLQWYQFWVWFFQFRALSWVAMLFSLILICFLLPPILDVASGSKPLPDRLCSSRSSSLLSNLLLRLRRGSSPTWRPGFAFFLRCASRSIYSDAAGWGVNGLLRETFLRFPNSLTSEIHISLSLCSIFVE